MVELQEFDDLKYPRRKPWLLLIIAAVGLGVFLWQRHAGNQHTGKNIKPPDQTASQKGETADNAASAPALPSTSATLDGRNLNMLIKDARKFEAADELVKARDIYLKILDAAPDQRLRDQVEAALGRINIALVMSPRDMPEKLDYVVKSGDFVGKIARHFGTTVQLIQKSNHLANPNRIMKGDRIMILTGKFRIVVSKKRHDLTLYMNDKFFKRYPVATGKMDKTPTGTFKIVQKSVEPVWWRPDGKQVPFGDPENILGTRWMSLKATGDTPDVRGYGIHGTWDDASIGKSASAGCIRMHNTDVEELYTLVPPGTPVEIVD